jgi:lipopolysaccharide/colanic/teichoic acid biosynthesis glycosyltransferase
MKMSKEQKRRFTVPPGLTGLAQISGNTSLLWGERIGFDLDYIDRQSIWLDLWILFKTASLIVTGRADTHPTGDSEWE